jgi:hypothetical protein
MRYVKPMLAKLANIGVQLYFEHADVYAPLLNLKKTKRKAVKGSKKPAVSMASTSKRNTSSDH